MLMVEGQADGQGVWGRWNANGPGTARLFSKQESALTSRTLNRRSADFMKIFWNESIGAAEKGHSVVFLELALPMERKPFVLE
jgi:hypothetical protein